MISATEARQLLSRQPLSEEAIEAEIRKAAQTRTTKCFDRPDVTDEVIQQLGRQGFDVTVTGSDVIVSW